MAVYDEYDADERDDSITPFPPDLNSRYARWLLDRRWRFHWARLLRGMPKVSAQTAYALHDGMRSVSECVVTITQEDADHSDADRLDEYCEKLLEYIDDAACSNPWHNTDPVILSYARRLVVWLNEIGEAYALDEISDIPAVEYAVQEQLMRSATFLELCAHRWARPFLQPAPLRWLRRWYLPMVNADWLVNHLNIRAQHMYAGADTMLLPAPEAEA